jgi:hypothetical protein
VQIDEHMHFPADAERTMGVLSDPAFQDEKCRATGALSHSVDVAASGDRTVITTERSMPTDQLPDSARSFVGATLVVKEIQDWGPPDADGARQGRLSVEIAGTPVRMQGTLAMTGTGDETTVRIDADLKANLPFVGARIEQAAAGPIRAAVRVEERIGQEWLSR